MTLKLKKSTFLLSMFFILSSGSHTALGQEVRQFSSFGNPKTLDRLNNKPGAVSIKLDPDIAFEITNDTLHSEKSSSILNSLKPDTGVNSRGVRDAALFKNISPSVVLILTKDGTGSGTIIGSDGLILTNYHVVGNNSEVGVVLKPPADTQKISKADLVRAKVIKIDQVTDLALVKLPQAPFGRAPVKLADESEISIGMDAHAIGHPHGDNWTYTKGVVSQYRNDFEWLGHKANVIQTQTPINPGNSGGPLLSDNGTILGVNSFSDTKAQGLNFAVSISDVKTFLQRNGSRYSKTQSQSNVANTAKKCEMKEVYKGKTSDGMAETVVWDSACSGKADLDVVIPYDKSKPIYMEMDRNGDGRVDAMLFSTKRDYKWEFSFWDDNYDGKWDLVGYHNNGEAKPYKFVNYDTAMASK
jgi:S1-C subfamily serine protease